jgi:hypothetical protein
MIEDEGLLVQRIENILNSHRVKLLVIVEDDIIPYKESDTDQLISDLLIRDEVSISKICNSLSIKHPDIVTLIKEIRSNYLISYPQLDKNRSAALKIGDLDYFKKFPGELGEKDQNEFLNSIEKFQKYMISVSNDLNDEFIYLGVVKSIPSSYNEIIKITQNNENINVRMINDLTVDNKERVSKELKKIFIPDSCLFLIDKIIDNDHIAGVEYIREIVKQNENIENNIYTIIITTDPKDDGIVKEMEGIRYYELKKGDANELISGIYSILVINIYWRVFKYIQDCYKNSVSDMVTIANKNPINIKFLIEDAKDNGIHFFQALMVWIKQTLDFKLDEYILSNYKEIHHMKEYIKEDCLQSIDQAKDLSEDFLEIRSSEIYDTKVNEKLHSVMPGDIFEIDEKLYLLIGQNCDIILRPDNTRKARLAEIIELELDLDCTNLKKYRKDHDNHQTRSIINYFPYKKQYTNIVIHYNTNKLKYCDFRILDLCTFIEDGSLNESIVFSPDNELYFPDYRIDYYKEIQKELEKLLAQSIKCFSDPVDFPIYKVIGADKINVKRLVHMKEPYISIINREMMHHRLRIGINDVKYVDKLKKNIKVFYSFLGKDQKESEIEIFEDEIKVSKTDILRHIDLGKYNEVIRDEYPHKLTNKNCDNKFNIKYKVNGEIEIIFNYCIISNCKGKIRKDFNPTEILKKEKIFRGKSEIGLVKFDVDGNIRIRYLDNGEEGLFLKEGLNIQRDIKRGIQFVDTEIFVRYEDGVIEVRNEK